MQTALDELLASISPGKTIVETFNRANQAINIFGSHVALIRDREKFKYFVAEFALHVECYVLRIQTPLEVSADYYWSQFVEPVFRGIYGPSGVKTAFEMARTGNDGGLYKLLRSVAMHMAEGYAKREIQARVDAYLESLTVDQQLEASSEYLAKYGHLLPSEMTEASAARIRADFGKVLVKHPWLLKKISEVGR